MRGFPWGWCHTAVHTSRALYRIALSRFSLLCKPILFPRAFFLWWQRADLFPGLIFLKSLKFFSHSYCPFAGKWRSHCFLEGLRIQVQFYRTWTLSCRSAARAKCNRVSQRLLGFVFNHSDWSIFESKGAASSLFCGVDGDST